MEDFRRLNSADKTKKNKKNRYGYMQIITDIDRYIILFIVFFWGSREHSRKIVK